MITDVNGVIVMDDVKAYLQQVKLCNSHIRNMIHKKAELQDIALQVTSPLKADVVSCGGGKRDKVGTAGAAIADLDKKLDEKIAKYTSLIDEIRAVVEEVDNSDQLNLLLWMYFGEYEADIHETYYLTLMEVAVRLRTSYRNACYIHGAALQAVAKVLERTKG